MSNRLSGEFVRTLAVIGITVVLFGVSFGFLAREAGLSGIQAVIMSLVVMAGATQFAAVTAFGAGASVFTASLAGVALSLRYLPLGAASGDALTRAFPQRLVEVHLLTDQGVVLGAGPDGKVDRHRYLAAGLTVTGSWVAGTAAGAWGGALVQDPTVYGIDAAYPALFIALMAPQLRRQPLARWAGAIGVAVVLATYPSLPRGLPVVLASLGALVGLRSITDADRQPPA